MGKTLIKIGPADHGRPISLEEFEHAKVQEGYLYELAGGSSPCVRCAQESYPRLLAIAIVVIHHMRFRILVEFT